MQSDAYIAPATTEGVVTFLDVMGWKGVYDRVPNPTVKLTELVRGLEKESERHRGKVRGELKLKSISDTIALFTNCQIDESSTTIDIHGELAEWAITNSLESLIPVRGVICFGQFAIQDNIFIGKAVDEAASWYEHADWIGVHLSPSAEFVYKATENANLWISYNPPTKSAVNWKPRCVNWTRGWSNRATEMENIKTRFRKLGPLVPEIAVKLTNTLNFIQTNPV